jgi:hypothetical protein
VIITPNQLCSISLAWISLPATRENFRDRQPYMTEVNNGSASLLPAYNSIERTFMVANYGANGGCVDNDGTMSARTTVMPRVYAMTSCCVQTAARGTILLRTSSCLAVTKVTSKDTTSCRIKMSTRIRASTAQDVSCCRRCHRWVPTVVMGPAVVATGTRRTRATSAFSQRKTKLVRKHQSSLSIQMSRHQSPPA